MGTGHGNPPPCVGGYGVHGLNARAKTIRTLQLLYDEDLVESVILFYASGRRMGVPPLQIRRFHHEREKLYSLPDPEERNAAFFRPHTSWLQSGKSKTSPM
jgi:hypothetical protein